MSSHDKQYSAGLFIPLDWCSSCFSVTSSPVWEDLPRFHACRFTAGCPCEVLPQFSAHSEHTKQVERGVESGSTCPGLESVTFGITDLCRGAKESQQLWNSGNSANSIMTAVNKSNSVKQIPALYRPITHWVIHRVKKGRKRQVTNVVYLPCLNLVTVPIECASFINRLHN